MLCPSTPPAVAALLLPTHHLRGKAAQQQQGTQDDSRFRWRFHDFSPRGLRVRFRHLRRRLRLAIRVGAYLLSLIVSIFFGRHLLLQVSTRTEIIDPRRIKIALQSLADTLRKAAPAAKNARSHKLVSPYRKNKRPVFESQRLLPSRSRRFLPCLGVEFCPLVREYGHGGRRFRAYFCFEAKGYPRSERGQV